MPDWKCVLELNEDRSPVAGSSHSLSEAIRRGADLRIYTEFRHNEHLDVTSSSAELVGEVAEFRITYLVDGRWVAGIMNLRQPVDLPLGFGPRSSMSFFMYNEDGRQAIARPHLDGRPSTGEPGRSPVLAEHEGMPKYHRFDSWDSATNAPSHNFVYDFDVYRYWVRDDWQELLGHTSGGTVHAGSVDDLAHAVSTGAEVKVGISGLCSDLNNGGGSLDHEVFVQLNSCYYYTEKKLLFGATHPLVRVQPRVPMEYTSRGWDFGWAIVRSDGRASLRLVNPYSLETRDADGRFAIRWFVR